ncbi:MAG: peptidase M75 [Cyanobacteria bacterium SBLK]|nr:peptidase M75 [Cyanobacteria bacterium SBLK]
MRISLKRLKIKHLLAIAIATFALVFLGFSRNNDSLAYSRDSQQQRETLLLAHAHGLEKAIIVDFVDMVIVPTYDRLVGQAAVMKTAIDRFVTNPTPQTLKSAQVAWLAARTPWEQSEAFAFGPAESLGYDGDLDDWPVNETDVAAILKSRDRFTLEYISNLQTTEKGFHTIEFLLFGTDNNKTVADFSRRERDLLKLLAEAFEATSRDLIASWVDGIDSNPPYREVLITAGDRNNPAYLTQKAALEEIVQGMIGCVDEVANEKIGVPLTDKTTDDLESRFSHSSLSDFKNNLQSVENAYLGGLPDTRRGMSLSDFIARTDARLDRQIKQELNAALEALEAIPDPIEPAIADAAALARLTTAQEAILQLFSTMEEKVLPLVRS